MAPNRVNRLADYRVPAIVLLLLAVALATRIYGAWCLRYNLNPDAGVVALMVKHMAEGRDFPVFFYGQPYMGSLEPLISAVLCRLFGLSGFLVCLGTALLGFLTLPVIYCWTRELDSSRVAGIAALAFLLVGPFGYFHYQISPRGGYAATLLFGTLVLWLSGRGIVREWQGSPPRAAWFLLLGLLAGLGWWSNQLVTADLITAALLVVLLLSPRRLALRTLAAAAGFALGSWPFWWWNAAHQWASFGFLGTFARRPMGEGLSLFFLDRLPDLLDLAGATQPQKFFCGAIYIVAALITAGVMFQAGRQRRLPGGVFGLMLFAFILISALIFSTSHFAEMNSPRYLLPLVPVVAVMVGVMTARFQAWLPAALAWAAWLPLLILVACQFPALQWAGRRARGEAAYQRQIESVGTFLNERRVAAAYIPYSLYAWHFALREVIGLSELGLDRYPAYSRQAELAERIAVFHNAGGLSEFLSAYGGSARLEQPSGVDVQMDFAPPSSAHSRLPVETIERITDSKGRDGRALAMDYNLDTWWESAAAEGEDEWVEIQFRKPERLSQLRLLFFPQYPPELQIEGRELGGDWRALTPVLLASWYFWSGPRPYCGDWLYRLNIVFAPVTVEALRLRRIGVKFGIRELQLYAPGGAEVPETQAFPELVRLIQERGLNRLYCDRWVANALHGAVGEEIQVPLEPTIFSGKSGRLDAEMSFTPQTGILARQEDADGCRAVLAARLVRMRETAVSPWVLFDFEPARWEDTTAAELGLQWAGFACFLSRNKFWTVTLARRADEYFLNSRKEEALELLFRAAREYPDYHPVTERLAWYFEANGRMDEAEHWRKESARLASPEIAAEIRFRNGAIFRGLTLGPGQVRPGEEFIIRYYWKYPTKPLLRLPRVFVHFQGKEGFFQDDHLLPRGASADNQPLPETFCHERTVKTPADLPAGQYAVKIGLFEPGFAGALRPGRPDSRGRRLRADTSLPDEHNAFILPVTLEVKSAVP
ncbi:MAG: hypothetical protein HYV35_11520 [Lentisphaerae bacterium]|nr:hypothetical protein [Lentisphaerota bacterium]